MAAVVDPRVPMWARCQPCGHVWVAAYVPMLLTQLADILKNQRCPSCASMSKRHYIYEPGRTPNDTTQTSEVAR